MPGASKASAVAKKRRTSKGKASPELERGVEKAVLSATADVSVRYKIHGGTPLRGVVDISGSKNAALPLMAASILCKEEVTYRNVPRLRDTSTMLGILEFLGAKTTVDGTTVTVNTDNVRNKPIPDKYVSSLRGSIVLLGPLLARFGEVEMGYPGGCVLGKRPVNAHTEAFRQMGVEDFSSDMRLHLRGKPKAGEVILSEFSVTATENILMTAALAEGDTRIELAAAEPHVQDVCRFLMERGAKIAGVGSHTLIIQGRTGQMLDGGEHTVTSDYLEAGAFILAGLVSKGNVTIRGSNRSDLISFLGALKRAGGVFVSTPSGEIIVNGAASLFNATRIQTNIFPGFPTDLQAPFGVLLSQATGVSKIFEVLFDGRMAYLYELEKMGAKVEILNSHQALVIGPTPLRGRIVPSNDIRAGVAMVIAGLTAEGETVVTDVRYIERGYDRLEEKLTSLGARIVREEE